MSIHNILICIDTQATTEDRAIKQVVDFLNLALKEFATETRILGFEVIETEEY